MLTLVKLRFIYERSIFTQVAFNYKEDCMYINQFNINYIQKIRDMENISAIAQSESDTNRNLNKAKTELKRRKGGDRLLIIGGVFLLYFWICFPKGKQP